MGRWIGTKVLSSGGLLVSFIRSSFSKLQASLKNKKVYISSLVAGGGLILSGLFAFGVFNNNGSVATVKGGPDQGISITGNNQQANDIVADTEGSVPQPSPTPVKSLSSVNVNGTVQEVPANGSLHEVITNDNGTTVIDVTNDSHSTGSMGATNFSNSDVSITTSSKNSSVFEHHVINLSTGGEIN